MERRVRALRKAGTNIEFHRYSDLGHGFGPGVGTSAEGWLERAVRFWEKSADTVDVSSRASVEGLVATATGIGEISGLIHAAGVSPTQASPQTVLKVDLYGTALVLEQLATSSRAPALGS
jgi:hypothetical protein